MGEFLLTEWQYGISFVAALVNRLSSDKLVISFFLFFIGWYFCFGRIPSENEEEISLAVVGTLI